MDKLKAGFNVHSGDCSIYASLVNNRPECGICTCGFGLRRWRESGDVSELFSGELLAALEENRRGVLEGSLSKRDGEIFGVFRYMRSRKDKRKA